MNPLSTKTTTLSIALDDARRGLVMLLNVDVTVVSTLSTFCNKVGVSTLVRCFLWFSPIQHLDNT